MTADSRLGRSGMPPLALFRLGSVFFAVCALALAACASKPAATQSGVARETGIFTVSGIPQKYIGGIILVTGENSSGEKFSYSPKIFQRCDDSVMNIKVYTDISAVQKPFRGNGEFTVTVSLYEAKDRDKSEFRQYTVRFANGSAAVRW